MLRRNPSLALRMALVFVAIYLAIFASVLVLMSRANLSVDGDGHHSGPNIALALVSKEVRRSKNAITVPTRGRFASLAARNPAIWVIGRAGNDRFQLGRPPPAAAALFEQYSGVLDSGKFDVPGLAEPHSDAIFQRRQTTLGPTDIAVGGVDPATLSFADGLRYFLDQGLVPLVSLGVMGLLATLLTLPVMIRALRRVGAEAAAVRPEQPSQRLSENAPRELLPIVRGFNAALDRLSTELARRKRLIADVSHELRTPLAIASLQVDRLPHSEQKADLQRVMTRISHLVSQMLDVERFSLVARQRDRFDLCALASEIVADLAPVAISSGYDISLEPPDEPVTVEGDRQAIGRAIANLVGNAVAHGGGHGQIRVVVGVWRTVDVIDEGPGVPTALEPSLFEPFSRERWDRDGCGLGLHLTRQIMRAHGGDAVLLPAVSGAAFRLEFPRPAGVA